MNLNHSACEVSSYLFLNVKLVQVFIISGHGMWVPGLARARPGLGLHPARDILAGLRPSAYVGGGPLRASQCAMCIS